MGLSTSLQVSLRPRSRVKPESLLQELSTLAAPNPESRSGRRARHRCAPQPKHPNTGQDGQGSMQRPRALGGPRSDREMDPKGRDGKGVAAQLGGGALYHL